LNTNPQSAAKEEVMDLSRITDETHLHLPNTIALAFPDGGLTTADVRRAVIEGRLEAWEIGGKTFTTLQCLKAMRPGAVTPAAVEGYGYVYVAGFGPYVKIGYTRREPDKRLDTLRTGAPEPLITYALLVGKRSDEAGLHRRFHEYRLQGEWFRKEGRLDRWIRRGCSR
jgi:hypothetical protein